MCFFSSSPYGRVLYVLFWIIFAYLVLDTVWDIYKKIFKKSDPMKILNERLAKGEITEKEYEKLKDKISDNN